MCITRGAPGTHVLVRHTGAKAGVSGSTKERVRSRVDDNHPRLGPTHPVESATGHARPVLNDTHKTSASPSPLSDGAVPARHARRKSSTLATTPTENPIPVLTTRSATQLSN